MNKLRGLRDVIKLKSTGFDHLLERQKKGKTQDNNEVFNLGVRERVVY